MFTRKIITFCLGYPLRSQRVARPHTEVRHGCLNCNSRHEPLVLGWGLGGRKAKLWES